MLELMSNNYDSLTEKELKIFEKLKFIFGEYLYNPRHEPINMNKLYSDLKDLGGLIYAIIKVKSEFMISETNDGVGGRGVKNKTKKIRRIIGKHKSSFSIKRKTKVKRFKKPIFLNLK